MADVVKSLEVNVEVEGQQSIDQLEARLKEVKRQLDLIGGSSKERRALNDEFRALTETLFDIKNQTGKATQSFDKMKDSSGVFRRGIEQVSQSMTNLANGTGSYLGNLSGLRQGLLNAAKGAKGFQLTLKGVRGALIATGIGALVVALGMIVAYWDDIKGLVNGVSREQRKLVKLTEEKLLLSQEQLENTESTENSLRLQGKTEEEIRDLKIQQTNEIIKNVEAQLLAQESIKKSQIEAEKRNKRILSGILKTISFPITFIMANIDLITKGLEKIGVLDKGTDLVGKFDDLANLVFDPEETEEKADEEIKITQEKLAKLKNTRDGYILRNKADDKKNREDRLREEEKAEKEKAEALERIRQGLIDTEAEERAEKLRLIKQDYWEQIELAKKFYGEESQVVLDLEEARRNVLKAQRKVFDDEDAEAENKRQESIEEIRETYRQQEKEYNAVTEEEKLKVEKERIIAELDLLRATSEQKAQIEAYYDKQIGDAKIDREKEVADAKREINNQLIDNVLNLAEGAFDKESKAGKNLFNVTKGIRVAQAIMDAYAAANAALAQTTDPTPTQSFRVANAAVAITSGLLNVKKILSTKIGSSGGGGNGGGGGGGNPVIQSGSVTRAQPRNINLTRTPNQQIDVNPIKVFVTESDISSAQINANNTKQVSVIK